MLGELDRVPGLVQVDRPLQAGNEVKHVIEQQSTLPVTVSVVAVATKRSKVLGAAISQRLQCCHHRRWNDDYDEDYAYVLSNA